MLTLWNLMMVSVVYSFKFLFACVWILWHGFCYQFLWGAWQCWKWLFWLCGSYHQRVAIVRKPCTLFVFSSLVSFSWWKVLEKWLFFFFLSFFATKHGTSSAVFGWSICFQKVSAFVSRILSLTWLLLGSFSFSF